jgi:3',5'-cyclic-AMP phosphodiesterase
MTLAKHLLTFVHISDTHLHLDPSYIGDYAAYPSRQPVKSLIDTINALAPRINFVLHTGDITHNPTTPEHYHIARDLLSQITHPVYYLPGNHDNVAMFQREFMGIPEALVQPHADLEFEAGGVQVVLVDSHRPAEGDGANGWLAADQLEWLDHLCSDPDDERPLIVATHHHPIPLEAPWLDRIVLTNGLALHQILLKAKHRLRGVFYGHIHESLITVRDGISYYSVPSAWFQTRTWYDAIQPANGHLPNPGFNLVTLTETDTFVRVRRIPL